MQCNHGFQPPSNGNSSSIGSAVPWSRSIQQRPGITNLYTTYANKTTNCTLAARARRAGPEDRAAEQAARFFCVIG
jgi:hypothetical protein